MGIPKPSDGGRISRPVGNSLMPPPPSINSVKAWLASPSAGRGVLRSLGRLAGSAQKLEFEIRAAANEQTRISASPEQQELAAGIEGQRGKWRMPGRARRRRAVGKLGQMDILLPSQQALVGGDFVNRKVLNLAGARAGALRQAGQPPCHRGSGKRLGSTDLCPWSIAPLAAGRSGLGGQSAPPRQTKRCFCL